MKLTSIAFRTLALSSLFAGALAQAATVSGTVTNKTTGKPSSGDTVVLVDVQAGMGEAAKATTDAKGHYTLNLPGSGPYLIRAIHQGAGYFIAAPEGGAEGNISVYDVAAKVQGVFIEADVIEAEAENGQLRVNERLFVHNTSSPPTTQWSKKSFSVVLPEDATIDVVGTQRPGGLPTSGKLNPDGPKGHYYFDFPIQPDNGDKDTLFQISYTLPYSSGKYDFKSVITLPADNFAVLLPKSMTFNAGAGQNFRSVQQDPNVQTFILKNAVADKPIAFTVSGTGSMPREEQGAQGGQAAAAAGGQPGGGIGAPINTPDPLSKYKWWILGGLALLLTAGAAFLLRKPVGATAPAFAGGASIPVAPSAAVAYQPSASPVGRNSALLTALKDELFAVESEKIAGTLSPDEYAKVKAALETVLARALKRNA